MKIVLFQPEIPPNTGNIARTCMVLNLELVLVRPLGFSIDERSLKRAGMDYWHDISVAVIDDLEIFIEEEVKKNQCPFYFLSSKASKAYWDAPLKENSLLIFGSESSGLPEKFFKKWPKHFLTIPMKKGARCLNLSSAAAAVACEAQRQNFASH